MSRIRKVFVTLSLVLAITAVQVPASAGPVEDTICYVTTEATKYGWGLLSDEPPDTGVCC